MVWACSVHVRGIPPKMTKKCELGQMTSMQVPMITLTGQFLNMRTLARGQQLSVKDKPGGLSDRQTGRQASRQES